MPRQKPLKYEDISKTPIVSNEQVNLLSTTEKTALTYHENVIEKGLETFIEVGQSLQYIRDNRLYRGDFNNFADYVTERWGYSKSWANNAIKSMEVTETLKSIGDPGHQLPNAEKVARPLARLKDDPELMAQVWEEAVAEAKIQFEAGLKKSDQPTHKEVEAKVKEYEEKIKKLELNNELLISDKQFFVDKHKEITQEFEDLFQTNENQQKQINQLNILVSNAENTLRSLSESGIALRKREAEIDNLIAQEADLKVTEILRREQEHLRLKEEDLDKKEKQLSTQLKSLKKNQSEVETAKKTLLGFEKWIEDLQRFNCFIKESTDSIISTTKNLQNLPDLTILTSAEKDLINPRISSEIETFWDNAETFGNAIQKISQDLKKLNKQVIKSIDVEVVVNE
jgi:hypothetical protein